MSLFQMHQKLQESCSKKLVIIIILRLPGIIIAVFVWHMALLTLWEQGSVRTGTMQMIQHQTFSSSKYFSERQRLQHQTWSPFQDGDMFNIFWTQSSCVLSPYDMTNLGEQILKDWMVPILVGKTPKRSCPDGKQSEALHEHLQLSSKLLKMFSVVEVCIPPTGNQQVQQPWV